VGTLSGGTAGAREQVGPLQGQGIGCAGTAGPAKSPGAVGTAAVCKGRKWSPQPARAGAGARRAPARRDAATPVHNRTRSRRSRVRIRTPHREWARRTRAAGKTRGEGHPHDSPTSYLPRGRSARARGGIFSLPRTRLRQRTTFAERHVVLDPLGRTGDDAGHDPTQERGLAYARARDSDNPASGCNAGILAEECTSAACCLTGMGAFPGRRGENARTMPAASSGQGRCPGRQMSTDPLQAGR
jgi:hypothetical protein